MSPDAQLFAAEHRLRVLRGQARAVYAQHPGMTVEEEEELVIAVFDREEHALLDLIDETPPRTLAGAAVKLRALVDHGCVGEEAETSLRQVLALIEAIQCRGC